MQDKNLQLLLDRLVPALNPIEVYLFGSRARGDAREDSDYDLFFVVPDDSPKFRMQDITALYQDLLISADVIPYPHSIFLKKQDQVGTLSHEVQQDGRRVYVRA